MKLHLPRLVLIALTLAYWPSVALSADPVPEDTGVFRPEGKKLTERLIAKKSPVQADPCNKELK